MKPEELIAICYAPWVLLGELGGFGFDGITVFFELGDGFGGVVDFKDAIYLADGCLFL